MTGEQAVRFGARIRRERARQGMSGFQLAKQSGLTSASIINRCERGLGEIGVFRAARIAAVLGVSLDSLLAEPSCGTCDGRPPPGFICTGCGTGGDAS